MKIAVYGVNSNAHFICQMLLKDPTVELVYHVAAHRELTNSNRYRAVHIKVPQDLYDFFSTADYDFVIQTKHHMNEVVQTGIACAVEERNIPLMICSVELSKLELDKAEGKRILTHLGIPTAVGKPYTPAEIANEFESLPRPFVLKYANIWRAGLQTVVVTNDNFQEEYADLLKTIESNPGTEFVVEEFIKSTAEYSYHALCNSTGWKYIGSARDYKKRFDGDVGYNTIGLGCYSPVQSVDSRVHEYCDKLVTYLIQQGTPYIGFLYLGITIKEDGTPVVLEINTRAGDPELQTILSVINTDNIVDTFYRVATNQTIPDIIFENKASVAVRLVNKDYRENLEDGLKLVQPRPDPVQPELDIVDGVVSSIPKGRLLFGNTIVATANDLTAASDIVYNLLEGKELYEYTYRRDIGKLL